MSFKDPTEISRNLGNVIFSGLGADSVARRAKLDPPTLGKQKPVGTLTQIPKCENALVSSGFSTDFRCYFQLRTADQDGVVSTARKMPNINDVIQWGDSEATPTISLDIPPQAISITTPFAISVVATNRGILEEHNGVVFKTIVISGTTGIIPRSRRIGSEGFAPPAFLTNFLPETATAVTNVVGGIQKVVSGITKGTKESSPKSKYAGPDGKRSGYGKFWRLHNFLLSYAEIKKERDNRNVRLVFGCPKDNVEYVCTPLQFEMKRDAAKPLLYHYNIVLKAWATTQPTEIKAEQYEIPSPRNPNAIRALTNTLQDARNVIFQGRNVLKGVNNDVQSVLNVAAQGIFFLKELAGLKSDILDFPAFFLNNINRTVSGAWDQLSAAINESNQSGDDRIKKLLGGVAPFGMSSESFNSTQIAVAIGTTLGLGSAMALGASSKSQYTQQAPGGETIDQKSSTNSPEALAGKKALELALQEPSIGSKIDVDLIVLPDSLQQELDEQKREALEINSGDIRELQHDLRSTADSLAQSIGMMDAEYARTYGLPEPDGGRTPTEDDIILMAALKQQEDGFGSMLSTGEILRQAPSDPFVNANEFLDDQDQMDTPSSGFLARLHQNEDLQQLALRTLGSANRWKEIVVLNDLKSPYIEAIQSSKPFSAPQGRTVLVDDIEGLSINQLVTIVATTSTRRKIVNIEDLGSTFRIMFNGQDNLSGFSTSPIKKLLYTTPGTLSPGDAVLIPSQQPGEDPQTLRPTPLSARLTHAEKVFKIDMAVGDDGDLKIGGYGDVAKSYGYDNAIQALKLALTVEKGELEQHPGYGMAVPVGGRNSDLTPEDVDSLVKEQVTTDPRFVDAQTQVKVDGSVVRIEIVAKGSESTGLIPIEFRANQPE